jgi:hypothetical protein
MPKKAAKRGRPAGAKNKPKELTKKVSAAKKTITPDVVEKQVSSESQKAVSSIIETSTGARREKGVAGSKTSVFPARFSLVPAIGLRRLAETCGEGEIKYGQGNWLAGFKQTDLLDHAQAHLNEYIAGDKKEDHLAHAAWNLFVAMHLEETEEEGSTLIDLVTQDKKSRNKVA